MILQEELLSPGKGSQSRPAAVLSVFFVSGIVLGDILPDFGNAAVLALSVVTVSLLCCFFLFRRDIFLPLIAIIFVMLGCLKYQSEIRNSYTPVFAEMSEAGQSVLVWGTVVDRPGHRQDRTRFTIRTDSLTDGAAAFRVRADLLVAASPDQRYDRMPIALEYGDYLLLHGRISVPAGRRNPYDRDIIRALHLNNISALLYVRGNYNIERLDSRGNALIRRVIIPARTHIDDAIARWIPGEASNFLRGLLLGDRSSIDPDVQRSFVNAGVIHVLAVSGLHVGIVTVICFSLLGFLRLTGTVRVLCTVAGLIFFMLLTGSAPSVVRATIMASIILIGTVVQRRSDIYNSISVSALIILVFDARQLFLPSFQLSYAAVLAIVYLYPRMNRIMQTVSPILYRISMTRYFTQLFLVSAAAQIGTLPFTAIYFERISLAALGVNLLIVPAVGLIISFGFAMSLFSLLNTTIGMLYAEAAYGLLFGSLKVIRLTGSLTFASIEVFGLTLPGALLFYSIVLLLINLPDPAMFRRALLILLVCLNIYVYYSVFSSQAETGPVLKVTMIDVGQGDALLLEFPHGETLLYDAGPRTQAYDAGERIVVPYLKKHGVGTIDAAVISHAHADHFGGLAAVIREIDVGRIYASAQHSGNRWYSDLLSELEERSIPYIPIRAGERIEGFTNARVYVVHPSPVFIQSPGDDRHWNLNNASVVLLVQYGNFRILLTGDAETEAEGYMDFIFGDFLDAEVLKAGHHGSNTSSTRRLLNSVRPHDVLISVGRENRFKHPSEEIIRRFESNNIRIYRTDRHGAVVVESCGTDIRVTPVRAAHAELP